MGRLGSNKPNKKKLGIVDTVAFAPISGEERERLCHRIQHSCLHFPVSIFHLCIFYLVLYIKSMGDAGDSNPGP